jgi:hypothetical protein
MRFTPHIACASPHLFSRSGGLAHARPLPEQMNLRVTSMISPGRSREARHRRGESLASLWGITAVAEQRRRLDARFARTNGGEPP